MTVFNTFLKILNKNKPIIIMYTVILIVFGGFNLQTSEDSTNFVATKPDVMIINNDENTGITKDFIDYIENNSNTKDIKNNEDKINDALFYRDINYIIYIPDNFREDLLNGTSPEIQIKTTGDYQASVAEMLINKYLKIANIYAKELDNEDEIIEKIDNVLKTETIVEVTSKIDTNALTKVSFYFNFLSYSILAGCVYVICLILSSFKNENINRRTIISSMNYKKHNTILLLANILFAIVLWIFYVILVAILLGDVMFSTYGFLYMLNSLIFTICAVTIAFFIATLIKSKNAINGIVNVVALGSSFLCGAFVPMEWLPNSVLTVAHILPSYWYIKTNEILKTVEVFNIDTLKPIIINMSIIFCFAFLIVLATNIMTKLKLKK